MENKICRTCGMLKSLDQYYSCKNCTDAHAGSCKICSLQRRTNQILSQGKIHPFNKEFRRSEDSHFSMAGCTKQDYEDMYDILTKMGYDVWGDVHKQFVDKFNVNEKYPMKYKKRKYNTENYYLPNGEINPVSKSERYKKTPTE